jgi:HlyD family secretion protein
VAKSTIRRTLVWLAIAAIAAAGAYFAFRPQAVPADIATVTSGPLQVTIDEEGETRVKETYVVSAPVAGDVQRIDIDVGDPVVAGSTVVAVIEPSGPSFLDIRSRRQAEARVKAAEAATAQARAEVSRARAELRFAKSDLRRAETLAARETISARARERAELDVAKRRAELATAEAALRIRLSDLEIARAALITPVEASGKRFDGVVSVRAPVTGRVLAKLHESEGVIQAGAPLIEIGDPDNLEIVVDLLSSDAVQVAEGATVLIGEWGGDSQLAGRVRRVEPYGFTKTSALGIEEQRVNVIVDFTGPPARRRGLGHGYRVLARIIVWQADDVVRVPLSALFRDAEAWAVFVIDGEGRARLQRIRIGRRNSVHAEVLDGLSAGERVVTHPGDRIVEGVKIVSRPGR